MLNQCLLHAWCLQNKHRIFYPNSSDLAGLQADKNPWFSPTCKLPGT
jgi:hypothetical protein